MYFKLTENDAAAYAKEKGFFDETAELTCREIGDGNINYVFRVSEPAASKSIIIKQADVLLRSSQRPLSTERLRIEARYLIMGNTLSPAQFPEIFLYDPIMNCMVMRDLFEYENMRHALLLRQIFPTFADDVSTFLAEMLMRTTDHFLDPVEKKSLCKDTINPEMCQISEKLVFTDPYTNFFGTNILLEENISFFEKELYGDRLLLLEVTKLYDKFKSSAQALLHGDLHTGSILVKNDSTMVLDAEFAFFGPIGYDVGNILANLVFAWVNAYVAASGETEFMGWLEKTIEDTADLFYCKATNILSTAKDIMAQTPGFAEWYMKNAMCDAMGFAGTEINRRIIGDAKVEDIAGIKDTIKRVEAERICVLCAKKFILERDKYRSGKDYVRGLKLCAEQMQI